MKKILILIFLISLFSLTSCNIEITNKETNEETIYEPSDNFLQMKINDDELSVNNIIETIFKMNPKYFKVNKVTYYKSVFSKDIDSVYEERIRLQKEWNNSFPHTDDEEQKFLEDMSVLDEQYVSIVDNFKETTKEDFMQALEQVDDNHKKYTELNEKILNYFNIKDHISTENFDYDFYEGQSGVFYRCDGADDVADWAWYSGAALYYFDGWKYAQRLDNDSFSLSHNNSSSPTYVLALQYRHFDFSNHESIKKDKVLDFDRQYYYVIEDGTNYVIYQIKLDLFFYDNLISFKLNYCDEKETEIINDESPRNVYNVNNKRIFKIDAEDYLQRFYPSLSNKDLKFTIIGDSVVNDGEYFSAVKKGYSKVFLEIEEYNIKTSFIINVI